MTKMEKTVTRRKSHGLPERHRSSLHQGRFLSITNDEARVLIPATPTVAAPSPRKFACSVNVPEMALLAQEVMLGISKVKGPEAVALLGL